MAANLPVLSNRDLNRAKNKKAADEAIPFVYETVIEWGCQKEEYETFLHYYDRREEKVWVDNKEEWEKELEEKLKKRLKKNWTDEQIEKERETCTIELKKEKLKKVLLNTSWDKEEKLRLDKNNCEGMDVTLLHKLVPTVCNGIGRYNPDALSSTKIEQYLTEVKNKRNDICHDPKGASVSGTILDELEKSAVKVLTAAGDHYASTVDKKIVKDRIDEFKEKLQKIKREMMTDDQQRILQTARKLCEDGLPEMQEAVMKQTTDYLPLSADKVTRATVFHPVDLLIAPDQEDDINDSSTDSNRNKDANREIPCHELLEHFEGYNVLCEGPPGTGKTTLLKILREDFVALSKERFSGVRKFDLLLYIECRNNSTTTIRQLLEQQFPMTLQQLRKEEAVEALLALNLLICVDGLDELTSHSKKLLQELLSKFEHKSNATFIFTSRPGQARSLSLSCQIVTLQPITDEKQQIDCLKRYQANIGGFKDSDLIVAFESLNGTCKAFLCQPVNLALFCAVFRKSPEAVKKWKSEVNLMNDVLRLSMLAMMERMNKMNLDNPECQAVKVTNAIFDLSLCLLQMQQMTITVETYTAMCQGIFGERDDVPYYSILSSFFIRNSDQQTFDFFHKSSIEFLAAKAIQQKFLVNPEVGVFGTIDAILRERRAWIHTISDFTVPESDATDGRDLPLRKYDNVMQFVIMMMVERGSSVKGLLKSFLKEVCPALAEGGGAKISFWVNLTLSCPGSDEVAEAAAQAANTTTEKEGSSPGSVWRVETERDMRAVSRMMRFHQPARLDVRPSRSEDLRAELIPLLKAVAQCHGGQLDLYLGQSFVSFLEIDDLVNCLEAKRFTLRQFRGCLGPSRGARQVLAAAVKRAELAGVIPDLDIALTHPRQHQLEGLEGTRHWLYVLAQLNPSEVPLRCPLPRGSTRPPELSVNCKLVENEVLRKTASLIENLAPQDGQYQLLSLLRWPGSDDHLDELLQQLSDSGVSTRTHGSQRWEPHGTSIDGRCDSCLSVHKKGWGRCLQLFVPRRDPRDADNVTRVYSAGYMLRVTSSLPIKPFTWLNVRTWRGEAPPPVLGSLLDAVAVWHRGKLEVNLFHSFHDFIPVDDLLARLHPAESLLVSFMGCLSGSSESAWRALVDGVQRAEMSGLEHVLVISLLNPWQHRLIELEGTRQKLEIRVRLPTSLRNRHRRPLPISSTNNPWLKMECRPAEGGGALAAHGGALAAGDGALEIGCGAPAVNCVTPAAGGGILDDGETTAVLAAALIEDLAPMDNTYYVVLLEHYPGTDDTLNSMVERLARRSVRTSGGDTAAWTDCKVEAKKKCFSCSETSHRPGERCVRLWLR